MGTRMAPSYANLFMAELEANLLTCTTHQPYIWWRFIDDIFAIWKHGRETLKQFLQEIQPSSTQRQNSPLNTQKIE